MSYSFVNCENDELSSVRPFIEMCHQLHKIDFSAAKKNNLFSSNEQKIWKPFTGFSFFNIIINSSTTRKRREKNETHLIEKQQP